MTSVSPKKIAFVTHASDPGGAEYKMMDLCASTEPFSEILILKHGILEELCKKKDLPYCVCPLPEAIENYRKSDGVISALKAIPASISAVFRLGKIYKNYDVIVCMSQKSFFLSAGTKLFSRRPIIWFMNDILNREHFSKFSISLIKNASNIAAHKVVLNSEASLTAWKKQKCKTKNAHIIYPGIDNDKIEHALKNTDKIDGYKRTYSPNQKPLIGIFGRLTSWKGQDVFLRALSKTPEVNGLIVGGALFEEEEYKRSLLNLSEELNLSDRIHFTDHVEDVAEHMAACDIIVHCSKIAEPFGQVIVQAMLSGTPVIASNAGGAREIIDHKLNGQLCPVNDDEALSKAITKYLNEPRWAKNLSKKAKEKAQSQFTINNMMENFKDLLAKI